MSAAASTDPAVYDPDRFDITVERERGVGFGGGIHHCLGHFVARTDMAEALPLLAQRMPRPAPGRRARVAAADRQHRSRVAADRLRLQDRTSGCMDLAALRLRPGEGRRIELAVDVDDVALRRAELRADPRRSTSCSTSRACRARGTPCACASARPLRGPCMRCLADAGARVAVDAREVDQPGGGEELSSPYVDDEELDLAAWARDALVARAPAAGPVPRRLRRAVPGVRRGPQRRPDPATRTSARATRAGTSSPSCVSRPRGRRRVGR